MDNGEFSHTPTEKELNKAKMDRGYAFLLWKKMTTLEAVLRIPPSQQKPPRRFHDPNRIASYY
jgi:hypothetical protein